MRSIPYLLFITLLVVIFGVFFALHNSMAYFDSFEAPTYSTGDTDGQNGWVEGGAATTTDIISSFSYQGSQAMYGYEGTTFDIQKKWISTTTEATQCFRIYFDNYGHNPSDYWEFGIYEYTGAYYQIGSVRIMQTGNVKYWGNAIYNDAGFSVITDTWLPFCIEYDTPVNDKVRYRFEDTYSPWYNTAAITTGANTIYLSGSAYFEWTLDYLTSSYVADEVVEQYYDLSEDCPDVLSYPQVCFLDETCTVWFQYNDLTVPATVYYVPEATPFPENAVDTAIAEYNIDYANYFEIPYDSQATGTTENFCLYVDLDDQTNWDCLYNQSEFVECGYSIQWVDRETYEANWNKTMDALFDTYSTTTEMMGRCEGICDENEGFFACGIHKGVCFLTVPSIETMAEFEVNLQAAKGEFPIKTLIEVQTILRGTASTSVDGLTIKNPIDLISGGSTTLEISSSTITSAVGYPMYNKVYDMMEQIMYIIGTGWLILYIYKLFIKKEEV